MISKFIAALDQSGGSSPATLANYGIDGPFDNEKAMLDTIHEMRLRIVNSPSFTSDYIDTAIIFRDSMERGLASTLTNKGIAAFLKVDQGMRDDGSMVDFDPAEVLSNAAEHGITGTKMRSVIATPEDTGRIVEQQYEYALEIKRLGFTPILEPEISINNPDKAYIELGLDKMLRHVDLSGMIVKVTLPSTVSRYVSTNADRIVGLSGGYSLEKCVSKLQMCPHIDASFSRALLEGLTHDMSDAAFDIKLRQNIIMVYKRGQVNE